MNKTLPTAGSTSSTALAEPGDLPEGPVNRPLEIGLGLAMIAVLGVMLLPLPPFVLDLLLSFSLSISLVVFLFALHIEKPLDFSSFPSVLLLTTLMRLALNVASTRLILLHGNEGTSAAGQVIQAFGQFVVGGNTIVGLIVFIILIIINFIVVSKGSGRIAEVAARFTLDSMPGKQMAIDADLAAGLCTETQARQRRKLIEQEADFFGSMDGASKFVRGDAVAALIICVVNILGGLVVGMLQQHMSFQDALRTYVSLTVGDGLVAQVPALLTSIAAGLVTTRASAGASLGSAVQSQLFSTAQVLGLTAAVLGGLALVPGMPHLSFFILAAILAALANQKPKTAIVFAAGVAAGPSAPEIERAELESMLPVDLLKIEVGYELVPLVDAEKEGSIIQRIASLRKQLAQELGLIIPPVHMSDNLRLKPNGYRVLLSGNVIGEGFLRPGKLLAMEHDQLQGSISGEECIEPAFGLKARWILLADKVRAEMLGYTVVDPATVITTHMSELLLIHAPELLGRREVQELLDVHGKKLGRLIEELLPTQLSVSQLTRILKNLLKERISIRDFRSILEAIADHITEQKDLDALTEIVRQRLAKQISQKVLAGRDILDAVMLSPAIENLFRRMQQGGNAQLTDSQDLQQLVGLFEQTAKKLRGLSQLPVLLTSADIRRAVSTFAARYLPQFAVLSFREIDPNIHVRTQEIIGEGIANSNPLALTA